MKKSEITYHVKPTMMSVFYPELQGHKNKKLIQIKREFAEFLRKEGVKVRLEKGKVIFDFGV